MWQNVDTEKFPASAHNGKTHRRKAIKSDSCEKGFVTSTKMKKLFRRVHIICPNILERVFLYVIRVRKDL